MDDIEYIEFFRSLFNKLCKVANIIVDFANKSSQIRQFIKWKWQLSIFIRNNINI